MLSGNQTEGGSPGREQRETEWAGAKAGETEPRRGGLHEDATILGDRGAEPAVAASPAGDAAGATVADLEEFRRALLEIGLVAEDELARFAAAAPPDEGVLGLARTLVTAGKLTAYQSAALYQRKGRGLVIGPYLILDKLGAGGMGVVFKARHRRLGPVVALKILPPSFARDRMAVSRFKREVEAAGRLNHPNIVAALEADEDRGVHFLVMEYVEGRDLDRVVRERGPLRIAEALDYLIQAARGLEAAHAQGIVHRDIKPSNLMLDAAGTVRVLDMGLALIVDASNPFGAAAATRLTASGMYMGTVDYMAPEQAEDSKRADHRADIYSLGCTLFYLLTAREPFVGETVLKRLMAHQERPAPALRAARPDAPTPLEEAYQKMMAKRPADRPVSMSEVIALLEACRAAAAELPATGPVVPPKSRPDLKVFDGAPLKRAPAAKAGHDATVFARRDDEAGGLQVGPELSLEDLVRDVRSEVPLVQPSPPTIKRAVKSPVAPPRRTAPSRTESPRRPWRPGVVDVLGTLGVLVAVVLGLALFRGSNRPASRARPGSRGVETKDQVPPGSDQPGGQPAGYSPRTELVARKIFDGRSGQGWMLTNGKPLPRSHVQADGLNPHGTGSYLVVYQEKVSDFVLDCDYKLSRGCNSGVFLRVGDLNDPVNTGIEVALDDTTGTSRHDPGAFYDLVAPRANVQKPAGEWNHLTITAQGPSLAVFLNGTEVSRIDLDEWMVPGKRPDGTAHKFRGVAIGRLARSGYIGFQDHGRDCWFKNVVLTTPQVPLPRSSGGHDQVAGGGPTQPPPPPPGPRREDEPYVEVGRLTGHDHPFVEQVRLLPDGKTLLTTSLDGTARLWDLATGRELRRLWHPAGVRAVAVLPDGRRAVTGCHDGWVRLWDLQTGQEVRQLIKHPGRVWGVAIAPDGPFVLSGGEDSSLRLSDLERGGEIGSFEGQASMAWSVAFSPDGRRVLSGGDDGVVRVGDRSGRQSHGSLRPLTGHPRMAYGVAFTRDARHAVSGGLGGLIAWDLDATPAAHPVPLDPEEVAWLAPAPDGRRVYFGTHGKRDGGTQDRGVLGSWDVDGPDPPRILNRGHGHLGVAPLPGGRIATSGLDGVVRLWQPSQAIARARDVAGRGERAAARAEYDRAIADRPDDARLLIERSRLLFDLGRTAEAEADYDRAARLAPDDPQLFLDTAGWWVAGPYPPDLKTPSPLESDPAPDPSKPPPPSGGQARRWHHVDVGMQGLVDLRRVAGSDDVAAYAMAIVVATSDREIMLLWGVDDAAQTWVNGERFLAIPEWSEFRGWFSITRLRRGRNTILAKVVNGKGPHSLNLRISDAPADLARGHEWLKRWDDVIEDYQRALARDPSSRDPVLFFRGGTALAEKGDLKRAASAFQKAVDLDPEDASKRGLLADVYFGLEDLGAVRRIGRGMVEKYMHTKDPGQAHILARAVVLIPDVLRDYTPVLRLAQRATDGRQVDAKALSTYGAVLYRAGKYDSAVRFLRRAIEAQNHRGTAFDWVFLAMALHRAKQPGDAAARNRAADLGRDASLPWPQRVEIRHLLREAELELSLPPP
jgi:serine/threonine protein kinase/tetratricopeptide (TPR) repeat protein